MVSLTTIIRQNIERERELIFVLYSKAPNNVWME